MLNGNVKFLPLQTLMKLSRPFTFLKNVSIAGHAFEYLHRRFTPQTVVMDVNGYKMRLNYQTGGVSKNLIEKIGYELHTTQIFQQIANRTTSFIIDIGANIGYYTCLARQYRPDSMVIAVEPGPNNLKALQENIELNRYHVTVLPYALADKPGTADFYESAKQCGECNIIGSHNLKATRKVTVKTLDSLMSGEVSLIKLDVEGAECMVLKGASKMLTTHSPDLIVECWEEGLIKAGSSVEELLSILAGYGYKNIRMIDDYDFELYQATPDKIRAYSKVHDYSVNLWCRKNA